MKQHSATAIHAKDTGTRVRWNHYIRGEAYERTGTVVMVDPTNEYGREVIDNLGRCHVVAAVRLHVID